MAHFFDTSTLEQQMQEAKRHKRKLLKSGIDWKKYKVRCLGGVAASNHRHAAGESPSTLFVLALSQADKKRRRKEQATAWLHED